MRLRWIAVHVITMTILAAAGGACNFTGASQDRQPTSDDKAKRSAIGAAGPKLYPVDEAGQDESFQAFREKLLDALKRRDADFVLAILDPNILNNLGGKGGIEEFKEQWKPEKKDSELWPNLIAVLEMGGSFELTGGAKAFCAPYVSSRWRSILSQLPSDAGPFEYQAVIGENVEVRSAPNGTAPIIASLSYNVIRVDGEEIVNERSPAEGGGWVKIIMAGKQKGYIQSKDVRSPSDYHACLRKKDNDWAMTVFAAGD